MKHTCSSPPKTAALFLAMIFCLAAPAWAAQDSTLTANITSLEAYNILMKTADTYLVDVRTPEEYQLIGHAPMAYNIPFMFLSDEFVVKGDKFRGQTAGKTRYQYYLNPDFIREVGKKFKKTDTLLVTCRSGNRSVPAVDLLVKSGFTKVYNISDGFEGDKFTGRTETEKDLLPQYSSFYGHRNVVNGWKFYGLPYTYHLEPKYIYGPHIKDTP
ncbi:MAG: sulfurtransferase [Deltaproteobacteria bacterium]|nr:sulfurtransferase [Candidatus Anaeroferrophillus wilburensis]MBN2889070.1 sulfurtransferase [Deltaproteobacteria bacterium]